jgi:hypothetical protein
VFDHDYPLCKALEKSVDDVEKLELKLQMKEIEVKGKDAEIKGVRAESHRQDEIIFELRSQLRNANRELAELTPQELSPS